MFTKHFSVVTFKLELLNLNTKRTLRWEIQAYDTTLAWHSVFTLFSRRLNKTVLDLTPSFSHALLRMKGPEKQKKKKKSNRFLAVPLSQLDVSPPYPRGIPRIDKSRSRARRQPSLQCWRWKPPTEPTVSPDKMWRRRPTLAWRKESHCISLDGTASKWPCKINGAAVTPSKSSTSLLLIFFLGSLNQMVFYFIDVLLWTSCFLLFNYLA